MRTVFPLIFLLAGCATPQLGGKTTYDVSFQDITPEQSTIYSMKIKAPPGVDIASVTGMTYEMQPDGSWKIKVSQDQATNTVVQAEAIVQSQALALQAATEVTKSLIPFIPQPKPAPEYSGSYTIVAPSK